MNGTLVAGGVLRERSVRTMPSMHGHADARQVAQLDALQQVL